MDGAINFVLTLILRLLAALLSAITVIVTALRQALTAAGVRGELQSGTIALATIVLIVLAIRYLGGVFGFLIAILLALMLLNLLMPGLHLPTAVHH